MRRILFRAKRIDNGEWVYGHYYEAEGNSFICGDLFSDGVTTSWNNMVDPETVGQFIGILDKDGKKIFEGDKVKCSYGIGVVVYNVGCFMVEWIDDSECLMEFVFSRKGYRPREDDEVFEVIGTIHDK